jgi:hypothetical protein
MHTVWSGQVDRGSAENLFVADASDLRLDGWPETMKTDIGNGTLMVRVSKKVDREGEILYVRYRQMLNGSDHNDLLVYND